MSAGYSKRPLFKKLGIKQNFKIRLIHPPENYFELLPELPEGVEIIEESSENLDFIHLFAKDRETLEIHFPIIKNEIKKNGMIWISWYKKAAKILTDLTEDVIRAIILPTGLVDVKVCAVDEKWSGLKVVWRKELR